MTTTNYGWQTLPRHREAVADVMLEVELQHNVMELCRHHKILVTHFRPGRRKGEGWNTPIQGDKGWPDLAMAYRGRLMLRELKRQKTNLTVAQAEWRLHLPPALYGIWRPMDWLDGTIARELAELVRG